MCSSDLGKEVSFLFEKDLAETIWTDRPAFPAGRVWMLDEALAGKSVEEKLGETLEKVEKEGADSLFLTKLDDLMWLFNIRGCDVECNPVAMSYAYLSREETVLFIQKAVLEDTAAASLAAKGVKVEEYDTVTDYLKTLPEGRKVMADQRQCSYALYRILSGRQTVVEKKNPTELLKAVKNPVELVHMEDIYLKDSVALTRFIYWLKTNIGKIEITEVTAADHLEMLRRQIPEFLEIGRAHV